VHAAITMTTRRKFLATAAHGATALALATRALRAKPIAGKPPMRFIFLHKGNGQFPSFMVPPTLSKDEAAIEAKKGPLNLDLMKHELPKWMLPIAAHQKDTTILQGLSGKHCTTTHNNYCSALGVFKATERTSSIKWATADFELAKLFPSPMEHIEHDAVERLRQPGQALRRSRLRLDAFRHRSGWSDQAVHRLTTHPLGQKGRGASAARPRDRSAEVSAGCQRVGSPTGPRDLRAVF
jgi:hypothetical protein